MRSCWNIFSLSLCYVVLCKVPFFSFVLFLFLFKSLNKNKFSDPKMLKHKKGKNKKWNFLFITAFIVIFSGCHIFFVICWNSFCYDQKKKHSFERRERCGVCPLGCLFYYQVQKAHNLVFSYRLSLLEFQYWSMGIAWF